MGKFFFFFGPCRILVFLLLVCDGNEMFQQTDPGPLIVLLDDDDLESPSGSSGRGSLPPLQHPQSAAKRLSPGRRPTSGSPLKRRRESSGPLLFDLLESPSDDDDVPRLRLSSENRDIQQLLSSPHPSSPRSSSARHPGTSHSRGTECAPEIDLASCKLQIGVLLLSLPFRLFVEPDRAIRFFLDVDSSSQLLRSLRIRWENRS